ncbi:aldose epimerase family protein [Alteromonas confluentis]|uniref:Aldose 1-epimerase n=1 Tax=Alteromonas confluentis TaxID=1656094 RepID=A0A1E7ZFX3_9ALTE|nr:aldose epimerase family protein [Alteromonas confluentis]OFC72425.1 hypothetical protein BFC18_02340 [Alteromonas confluentis]
MPDISVKPFGAVNGCDVSVFTLRNDNGMTVSVTNFGGIVTAINVADRQGHFTNVVAGLDCAEDYANDGAFLGALVGPYANRIANGAFAIDGQKYQLEQNAGTNNLHSASAGINKKVWQATSSSNDHTATLTLTVVCPDGEGGFPGDREIIAEYSLDNTDTLSLVMKATSTATSPLSLTSHGYFNLAGEGNVLDHQVMINADTFTPLNADCVPTGELRSVSGTPFDFRAPKTMGEDISIADEQLQLGSGYDHNFVLNTFAEPNAEPAATVIESQSGRVMTLWTNTPGLQFYSANCLSMASAGSQTFVDDGALCLEPQAFPDTPNHPEFPGGWIKPGEEHVTWMKLNFSVQD